MARATFKILWGSGFRDEIQTGISRFPNGYYIGRVDLLRTAVDAETGRFTRARYHCRVLTAHMGFPETVRRLTEEFVQAYGEGVVGLEAFNEGSSPPERWVL